MAVSNTLLTLFLASTSVLFAANTYAQGALSQNEIIGVDDAVLSDPFASILEVLRESSEHSVLLSLLAEVGLDEELGVVGNRLTVLAPTNSAFANFARRLNKGAQVNDSERDEIIKAVRDGLKIIEGPALRSAKTILSYHVISSANSFQALEKQGEVETLAGQTLTFENRYKVFDKDDSREITAAQVNMLCQNGWRHSVNDVLLPFNLERVLESLKTPTPTPSPVIAVRPTITPTPSPSQELPEISESPEESLEPGSSDDPDGNEDDGVCFPSTARVHMAGGHTIAMADLESGHDVMHNEDGAHSAVFLFTHRNAQRSSRFLRLTTSCGHAVTMTRNHYVYAGDKLMAAGAVRVGDELRTISGRCAVTDIEDVEGTGLYAPHSMHGDLVVDGIVVSGYSRAVAPRVAHALLVPVRWAARWMGVAEPLGRTFYDGGDWALHFLPRGRDEY